MKKRKRRKGGNRRAMMGIVAVLLIIFVCLTIQSHSLAQSNATYAEQEAKLNKQIAKEMERTEEIAELKEYMQTDEYVEKIAKDKLGLVYEDEILFKPEN